MKNRRMIEIVTASIFVCGLLAGLAGADALIPGGGPTKSDCYVEAKVEGIENPSDRVQNNKTVLITDGEAGDTGPCGDFKCSVRVAACINQNDPNLPDCTPPASLDSVTVKGAFTITVPQVLTGSACGAFLNGDVDAKVKRDKDGNVKKAKAGKKKIKLKAKGVAGTKPRNDVDTVTVSCLPRTVECPPASASGAFVD